MNKKNGFFPIMLLLLISQFSFSLFAHAHKKHERKPIRSVGSAAAEETGMNAYYEPITVTDTVDVRLKGSPKGKVIDKIALNKWVYRVKTYRHWTLVEYTLEDSGKVIRGFIPNSSVVTVEEPKQTFISSLTQPTDEVSWNDDADEPESTDLESGYCDSGFCRKNKYAKEAFQNENLQQMLKSAKDIADEEDSDEPPQNKLSRNNRYSKNKIAALIKDIKQQAVKPRKTSKTVFRRTKKRILYGNQSKGMCYQAVKQALQGSGMVNYYLGGSRAIEAHTGGHLRRAGFKNLVKKYKNPSQAPPGCILVYRGGYAGHIEIATGEGYCSDMCNSQPISSKMKNRHLEGVYCK